MADEAVLRIVVQDEGGLDPDAGPPENPHASASPFQQSALPPNYSAPPRNAIPQPPPAQPAAAARPQQQSQPPPASPSVARPNQQSSPPPRPQPAFDPVQDAKRMREAEVRREETKLAYERMYGSAKQTESTFDVILSLAQKLRGTLGGAFGPLVGSILDLFAALQDARQPDKSSARIEAESRYARMAPSVASPTPAPPDTRVTAQQSQDPLTPDVQSPVGGTPQSAAIISEAREALRALGNTQQEAEKMLQQVLVTANKTFASVEEVIRAAYEKPRAASKDFDVKPPGDVVNAKPAPSTPAEKTVATAISSVMPSVPTIRKAEGGVIPQVPGIPLNADEVPIKATAGEFVVKKDVAQKPENREFLESFNAGESQVDDWSMIPDIRSEPSFDRRIPYGTKKAFRQGQGSRRAGMYWMGEGKATAHKDEGGIIDRPQPQYQTGLYEDRADRPSKEGMLLTMGIGEWISKNAPDVLPAWKDAEKYRRDPNEDIETIQKRKHHFDDGGEVPAKPPSLLQKAISIPSKVKSWAEDRYGKKSMAAAGAFGQAATWALSPLTIASMGLPLPPGTGILTGIIAAEIAHRLKSPDTKKREKEQQAHEESNNAKSLDLLGALPKFTDSGAGHFAEGGEVPKPDKQPYELTKKKFYSQYSQHSDLRSKSIEESREVAEKIKEEGFKSSLLNTIPPTKGEPENIIEKHYGTSAGKLVYAVPNKQIDKSGKIKSGWKPSASHIVEPAYDYQPLHESIIDAALSRGEIVPPKVLAEYPELAEKYKDAHKAMGGEVRHYALGTSSANGPDGVDKIPAMLTRGEGVVNEPAMRNPESKAAVENMNRSGSPIPNRSTNDRVDSRGPWSLESTQQKVLASFNRGPVGGSPASSAMPGMPGASLPPDMVAGNATTPQQPKSFLHQAFDTVQNLFGSGKNVAAKSPSAGAPKVPAGSAAPAAEGAAVAEGAAAAEGAAGMAAVEGAMAAAAGPIAIVMLAVDAAKKVVTAVRDVAAGAVRVVGDAAVAVANPDSNPANVVTGIGETTKAVSDKILFISPVLGILGGAAGEAASSLGRLMNAVDATANRYAEYSAPISQAQAMAEVQHAMGEIRRSQEAGPELARYIQMQGDLQQKFEDIKIKILMKILPIVTAIGNLLERAMPAGEGIEAAITLMGGPLLALANAAGQLVNLQADALRPHVTDPTDILFQDSTVQRGQNRRGVGVPER